MTFRCWLYGTTMFIFMCLLCKCNVLNVSLYFFIHSIPILVLKIKIQEISMLFLNVGDVFRCLAACAIGWRWLSRWVYS